MKEIFVYGEIGWDVTAEGFREQLEAAGGEDVMLRIHSRGGSVMEGVAMITAIQRYEGSVRATVDGLAASMAANLAMAVEYVSMPENAWVMFHEANVGMAGAEADELERMAAMLRLMNESIVEILHERTGEPMEELRAELKQEMWLTGRQAAERGIVHEATKAVAVAARLEPGEFEHVPAELRRVDNVAVDMASNSEKSGWSWFGKKPESEPENAKQAERLEQIENALAENGPVHMAIVNAVARMDEAVARLEAKQAELDAKIAEAEKLEANKKKEIAGEAALKAIDIASAQGQVMREVPAVQAEEDASEEEPEMTAGERWQAMPQGEEKRAFYRAHRSEILRTVQTMQPASN